MRLEQSDDDSTPLLTNAWYLLPLEIFSLQHRYAPLGTSGMLDQFCLSARNPSNTGEMGTVIMGAIKVKHTSS